MTLRQKVIEAGAEGIWRHINSSVTQSVEAYAVAALDAMLDCLTENADEWRTDTVQRYGLMFKGKGHGFQSWNIEEWLAVLREDR